MSDPIKVWEMIPTLGGGGAEKMVLDLAHGLGENGVDTTVISLYGPEHAAQNRLEFARDRGLNIRYMNKKSGFDPGLLFKLAKLIRKERPDIIHTHLSSFQYVMLLGYVLKIKHIHTMHSIAGREKKAYEKLLKTASKHDRTCFVALSEEIGKQMKTLYGTDPERLHCIPNGIDRDHFKRIERKFDINRAGFITVGSMIPVKNQRMLIDAFSMVEKQRNNRDRLVILGDGSLRDELTSRIAELGLDDIVSLPGNVSDVRKYLYEADVFVMTSHYEGVSLALLEAASTGLPVLVTNTGNTPSVVLDDAILIDDEDAEHLAAEMLNIAQNAEYRKLYSDKAEILSSRHDKKRMVRSYIDLYTSEIRRSENKK